MEKQKTDFPYLKLMPRLTDEQRDIVDQNLGLVKMVVNSSSRIMPDEYDDYIQAGCIGLIRAVQKYEPDRGLKLSTYAVPWIRAAISYQKELDVTVRVPRNMLDKYRFIADAKRTCSSSDGIDSKIDEISEHTGLSKEKVRDVDKWMVRTCFSLSKRITSNGVNSNSGTEQDLLTYKNEQTQDEMIEQEETRAALKKCISRLRKNRMHGRRKLPKNIREIVVRRCIMGGEKLSDVALDYDVSRERIRQLKEGALAELRRIWKREVV